MTDFVGFLNRSGNDLSFLFDASSKDENENESQNENRHQAKENEWGCDDSEYQILTQNWLSTPESSKHRHYTAAPPSLQKENEKKEKERKEDDDNKEREASQENSETREMNISPNEIKRILDQYHLPDELIFNSMRFDEQNKEKEKEKDKEHRLVYDEEEVGATLDMQRFDLFLCDNSDTSQRLFLRDIVTLIIKALDRCKKEPASLIFTGAKSAHVHELTSFIASRPICFISIRDKQSSLVINFKKNQQPIQNQNENNNNEKEEQGLVFDLQSFEQALVEFDRSFVNRPFNRFVYFSVFISLFTHVRTLNQYARQFFSRVLSHMTSILF